MLPMHHRHGRSAPARKEPAAQIPQRSVQLNILDTLRIKLIPKNCIHRSGTVASGGPRRTDKKRILPSTHRHTEVNMSGCGYISSDTFATSLVWHAYRARSTPRLKVLTGGETTCVAAQVKSPKVLLEVGKVAAACRIVTGADASLQISNMRASPALQRQDQNREELHARYRLRG
jgi:hypothetical protein